MHHFLNSFASGTGTRATILNICSVTFFVLGITPPFFHQVCVLPSCRQRTKGGTRVSHCPGPCSTSRSMQVRRKRRVFLLKRRAHGARKPPLAWRYTHFVSRANMDASSCGV